MKRPHLSLVLIVVVVLVSMVAYERNWLRVTSGEEPETKAVDVHVTVDREKIKQDAEKAVQTSQEKAWQLSEKVSQEAQTMKKDLKTHSGLDSSARPN